MSFTTRRFGWQLLLLATLLLRISCESLRADDAPPDDTAKYGRKLNDEERIAALEMLAKAMRENYEKIKTWRGEYHFIDMSRFRTEYDEDTSGITFVPAGTPPQLNHGEIPTGPDAGVGHWSFSRGTFRFSLDQTKGKYYVFYEPKEPTGIVDVKTGREGFASQAGSGFHGLLTSEHSLTLEANTKYGIRKTPEAVNLFPENWSSQLAYRLPSKIGFHVANLFDTRDFYLLGGNNGRWKICEATVSLLRGERGEEFRDKLTKSHAMYVNDELPPVYTEVQTSTDQSKGSGTLTIYDGKVGFNVVRDVQATRQTRFEYVYSYRNVSGVFIPVKYEKYLHELREDKLIPKSHRSFELLNTELNVDIPESAFDIKQFGLKYGDRMIDEFGKPRDKQKKLYLYDDQIGFVPAAEFHFDPTRVPKDEK